MFKLLVAIDNGSLHDSKQLIPAKGRFPHELTTLFSLVGKGYVAGDSYEHNGSKHLRNLRLTKLGKEALDWNKLKPSDFKKSSRRDFIEKLIYPIISGVVIAGFSYVLVEKLKDRKGQTAESDVLDQQDAINKEKKETTSSEKEIKITTLDENN